MARLPPHLWHYNWNIRNHEPPGSLTQADIWLIAFPVRADGVSPCRFLGYDFKHRQLSYFVSDDGLLRVTRGSKTLAEEAGQWQP